LKYKIQLQLINSIQLIWYLLGKAWKLKCIYWINSCFIFTKNFNHSTCWRRWNIKMCLNPVHNNEDSFFYFHLQP